eukprot:4809344-Heterocapsa_arctica.AAC.1
MTSTTSACQHVGESLTRCCNSRRLMERVPVRILEPVHAPVELARVAQRSPHVDDYLEVPAARPPRPLEG